MAIKASDTMTLASVKDVASVTPYYLTQTSTLSPPSKPTANPPTGWSMTQPALNTSKTCYIVFLNVFSDGTWAYSDVSTMSEYEAAKAAQNTATAAQTAVEAVNQHFWHDNEGAHVTEVTQDEWNDSSSPNYHSGGNTLITATSMAVRDGLRSLAEFGQVVRVGAQETSRVEIDPDGVYVKSESGVDALAIETGTGQESQTVTYSIGTGWSATQTTTVSKTVSKLSTLASGTSFNAKFVIDMVVNGGQVRRTEVMPFVKGASSSRSGPITVTYNGTTGFTIKMTISGTTTRIGTTFSQISWEEIVYTSKLDMAGTVSVKGDISASGTIKAEGHRTAIGYKTERQTGTYSLATGTTFVTVPESALSRITLSEGTWIIHAHAAFASNATGRRVMRIYSVTSSEGLTRSFVNQNATDGAATNMSTMAMVSVGSTDITYTIQLAQNSGSAKSVDLVLEAVRIA